MPWVSAVNCCRREAFNILFQETPREDISLWDLVFEVRSTSFQGTVIEDLTKTVGDGITLTNPESGEGKVSLSADDTDMVPAVYYATISRTDAGNEAVLGEITWTLRPPRVPD